jgi:hypothetical protein
MIRFACPRCNKILKAPDEKAGVKVACPGCRTPLLIPSVSPAPPPPPSPRPSVLATFQEQAQKIAGSVRQMFEAARQTPQPKSTKKTLVLAGVVLAFFSLLICGGVMSLVMNPKALPTLGSGKKSQQKAGKVAEDGMSGELTSFEEIPPPVLAAVNSGKQAWEFRPVPGFSDSIEIRRSKMYVIFEDDALKQIIGVYHYKKLRERDEESVKWEISRLDSKYDLDEGKFVEFHWALEHEGKNKFTVSMTNKSVSKEMFSTVVTRATAVIDEEVGEGFWTGDENTHIKYRGTMANMPDQRSSKRLNGVVLHVKKK